jgi:hypothetical protein
MILTAAAIIVILVAVSYSNNLLNTRMAENEYSTNKQFMRTIGLEIDDVAWTIGRTQTVSYSCKFGYLNFQEAALTYTVEFQNASGWYTLDLPSETGVIMYNIPVSTYSVGENYFEPILYTGSFVQNGSLAPVSQVYCIEKLSMTNGSYSRVVVAPTIRMLNSTIVGEENIKYYKFYLPILEAGQNRYGSNSISLTGSGINKQIASGVDSIRITVSYPKASWGFDSTFFKFDSEIITIDTTDAVVEFYAGRVSVGVAYGG